MLPDKVWQVTLWWGPGMLIVLVFGYGFLRLSHYWIEKNMEMKRHQMESAFGIARQYVERFLTTERQQADALSRLASSIEQRDTRDSFEHQEMLIALKALHCDLEWLPCRRSQARPPDACPAGPEGLASPGAA
jgi:hypothetical protein